MLGLFSFSHPAFGELHGMVENEALWLIGEEVTRALGYKKAQTALQKHVKPEDKKPLEEDDGLKKSKNATIMSNESGLYSLCFFCKRSKAKKFKQWMAKEIMPAVRKNLDDSPSFGKKNACQRTLAPIISAVLIPTPTTTANAITHSLMLVLENARLLFCPHRRRTRRLTKTYVTSAPIISARMGFTASMIALA